MTTVAMLLFPRLTQLDLTAPYEVLQRLPGVTVELVWKTREAVRAESGLGLLPTNTFEGCPRADVLFVPGGAGLVDVIRDPAAMAWVRGCAAHACWVTSVCTGALVLGAAGLLRGRRATTHWASHGLLPLCGAIPVEARTVVDGNLMTGGGVTAGLDLALVLAAQLFGQAAAEKVQLTLEYDPHPPFKSGHPRSASAALVSELSAANAARLAERRAALEGLASESPASSR